MDDNTTLNILASIDKSLLRIAAALEAKSEPEDEKLSFPLSDYANFDYAAIGATIVQRDSDGVSVIRSANGKFCKRRSNDKFGTEIWFSYCSGKAADGTPEYVKVLEFRNVAPPEPLGRKTEQAVRSAATQAAPKPQAPPATAIKPANAPVATIAVPIAPPKPEPPRQPAPAVLTPAQDNMFIRWQKAADKWRADKRGEIPFYYALEDGLTEAGIQLRVENFEKAASVTTEQLHVDADNRRTEAALRLKALVDEATRIRCEIPASFVQAWPSQDAAAIELTIGTVTALLNAHKNKYPNGKPPAAPALNLTIEHRILNSKQETAFKNKFRVGPNDATHVYLALNDVAGGDAGRHSVIKWATDGAIESQKNLPDAWIIAFRDWLKPYKNGDGKWHVASTAAQTIAKVLEANALAGRAGAV